MSYTHNNDKITFTETERLKAEIIHLQRKLEKEKLKNKEKCNYCGSVLGKNKYGKIFCFECNDL